MEVCLLFVGAILALTSLWVYLLRDRDFTFLAYAMFFPGVLAFLFSGINGSLYRFVYGISGVDKLPQSVLWSFLAACIVYLIVETCAFLAVKFGWAIHTKIRKSGIHAHNRSVLSGFLRAAGEEVGWRCFLLPCLLDSCSTLNAFLLSGLAWGLFHVPIMLLLTKLLKPPRPYLTVAVQCASCVLAAFPHGWVAVRSGYTLWASSIMHWVWNIYNPSVLGSIYTNTPGRLNGPQWLINGEGISGCLVMLPVAVAVIWDIENNVTPSI